jgi:hypothetical protein
MKCALAMKTYGALKEIACSKRFKERKIQSGSIASNPIRLYFLSCISTCGPNENFNLNGRFIK